MDYTNYNNTEMQQRIALARANSGYIAPSDKQAYHRTTNKATVREGLVMAQRRLLQLPLF